ncbi:hypothetical protein U1Q18_030880 [Sarracenia purpurea var. burkii]
MHNPTSLLSPSPNLSSDSSNTVISTSPSHSIPAPTSATSNPLDNSIPLSPSVPILHRPTNPASIEHSSFHVVPSSILAVANLHPMGGLHRVLVGAGLWCVWGLYVCCAGVACGTFSSHWGGVCRVTDLCHYCCVVLLQRHASLGLARVAAALCFC